MLGLIFKNKISLSGLGGKQSLAATLAGFHDGVQNKQQAVKYAFLNLKGHPRGNLILNRLIEANFYPSLIIEEDSLMAVNGTTALNAALNKLDPKIFAKAPSMESIFAKLEFKGLTSGAAENYKDCTFRNKCRYIEVKNHNNAASVAAIKESGVDCIVLGDCRIMKDTIIKLAPKGVINTHPGYLPEVRGNHCSLYAIIHDLPIGCTVHKVDVGIDTGPIIGRQRLRLDWKNLTYEQLMWHLNVVCAELAVDAVKQLKKYGELKAEVQQQTNIHDFGTFTAIEPIMKAQAIKKLESGGYFGGSMVPMKERYKIHKLYADSVEMKEDSVMQIENATVAANEN